MSKQIWNICDKSIVWSVEKGQNHYDDIEMSGLYADYIVKYGVNADGSLHISQKCYFPTLRTIPNNTHATFCFSLSADEHPVLLADGAPVVEYPTEFSFDGTLSVKCNTNKGFSTVRRFFPASDSKCCIEYVTVCSDKKIELDFSKPETTVHSYGRGTKGVYVCRISRPKLASIRLDKGHSISFGIFYTANVANEQLALPNVEEELEKRMSRVRELCDNNLVLKTNNVKLDTMLRFAKLRAGESVFETLTGKYHSPGGHAYYAATWCNDEAEYAGPHFALTNDKIAIEASINAYKSYMPFMSDAYFKLPCSIISEGLAIWEGAGDRGDAAMYLYGCSLFCLYLGNREVAEELYPAIKWCAEYCERQKTPEGVIRSDKDELEGRFPTDGYANLSTSSLCYGGLRFAAKLARSLGDESTAVLYNTRADELENAIEAYFGATLRGFATYRYSNGFNTLRAWICLPLCMGINTRAEGTLDAMLSDYLWTEEGMYTCERSDENTSDTIWDRSTLYGMKCAFLSGAGDKMLNPLLDYCHKRLLCDRVPYAVEAYPEGDKRHLSGESALFVRVITEGLLAIMPESLNSFSFVPAFYDTIGEIELSSIFINGKKVDITVGCEKWSVSADGKVVAFGNTDNKRVVINL